MVSLSYLNVGPGRRVRSGKCDVDKQRGLLLEDNYTSEETAQQWMKLHQLGLVLIFHRNPSCNNRNCVSARKFTTLLENVECIQQYKKSIIYSKWRGLRSFSPTSMLLRAACLAVWMLLFPHGSLLVACSSISASDGEKSKRLPGKPCLACKPWLSYLLLWA